MMGAPGTVDAVERARGLPDLGVGLHLSLVRGWPVLPAADVRALVNRQGEFLDNLFHAGVRFYFRPGARGQLEREIRAQFEAFAATGLDLDHVSPHNHMHLHPTVLGLLLRVGTEFGMRTVRVPEAPRGSGLLRPWIRRLRTELGRRGIESNDFLVGVEDSGSMTTQRAAELLDGLPEGVTEIYFHPATRRCPEIDRDMSDYDHEAEFRTLVSAEFRNALDAAGAERIRYRDLSAVESVH